MVPKWVHSYEFKTERLGDKRQYLVLLFSLFLISLHQQFCDLSWQWITHLLSFQISISLFSSATAPHPAPQSCCFSARSHSDNYKHQHLTTADILHIHFTHPIMWFSSRTAKYLTQVRNSTSHYSNQRHKFCVQYCIFSFMNGSSFPQLHQLHPTGRL
jgi:hypothetical protein